MEDVCIFSKHVVQESNLKKVGPSKFQDFGIPSLVETHMNNNKIKSSF
jgi:hypothetical protein